MEDEIWNKHSKKNALGLLSSPGTADISTYKGATEVEILSTASSKESTKKSITQKREVRENAILLQLPVF